MTRNMLKSKIHRATVTANDIDYEGSVSIDTRLLEAADDFHYRDFLTPGNTTDDFNQFSGNRPGKCPARLI